VYDKGSAHYAKSRAGREQKKKKENKEKKTKKRKKAGHIEPKAICKILYYYVRNPFRHEYAHIIFFRGLHKGAKRVK
jgi:iron only hydrogenase large subunit-like protein